MFEGLDETIKHDTEQESTRTERMMHWAIAVVLTVLVLGGLYYGVHFMQ